MSVPLSHFMYLSPWSELQPPLFLFECNVYRILVVLQGLEQQLGSANSVWCFFCVFCVGRGTSTARTCAQEGD